MAAIGHLGIVPPHAVQIMQYQMAQQTTCAYSFGECLLSFGAGITDTAVGLSDLSPAGLLGWALTGKTPLPAIHRPGHIRRRPHRPGQRLLRRATHRHPRPGSRTRRPRQSPRRGRECRRNEAATGRGG
jgi:hypothetical protein